MKKIIKHIVGAALAILPLALSGQTQTENHVVSKTYKRASTTAITNNNPDSTTTAIQYFDGLGRAKQSVLVKGGKAGYGNNQLPYDWTLGNTGSTSFFNKEGTDAENNIVNGTTPFGDTDLLWECKDTNSLSLIHISEPTRPY